MPGYRTWDGEGVSLVRVPGLETTKDFDPFYSESNMARLNESEQQYRDGRVVAKTMKDLETIVTVPGTVTDRKPPLHRQQGRE